MAAALNAGDRRALLMGGLALTLLLGAFRGFPALLRATSQARELAVGARAEAARARSDAASRPLRAASLRDVSSALDSAAAYVMHAPGTSTLVAQSSQEVAELAASLSVLLQEVSTMAVDSSRAPLRVIRLRLTGEGDVLGIPAFLGALEAGSLMADVRRLRIDAADPSAPIDRPERLHFEAQIDVVGWVGERPK